MLKLTVRRPGQTLACGWCTSSIFVPARGRPPKWCSSSDRTGPGNSPEAAFGLGAVQVIEQIDTGKVYGRDLPALTAALGDVRSALNRRPVRHRNTPS